MPLTRRPPTHKERILELLSDGEWHDTVELHEICWRYGARLWELRRAGYALEKRRTADPRIEEWRLAATPGGRAAGDRPPAPPPPRRRERRPCASGNVSPAQSSDRTGAQRRLL